MAPLLEPAERARIAEQFAAVRRMSAPIPASERYRHSIEQVGVGGYLRFEDFTYRVVGRNVYERHGVRWPELVLYRLEDGGTMYLEWEKEDEVSVYVSRAALSLDSVGIRDRDHLRSMAASGSGSVQHDGATFRYHEDSSVTFIRDGKGPGRPFRQYLFASAKRDAFVGVEEWGDADRGFEHNVILSEYVDPKAIEVLVRESPDG